MFIVLMLTAGAALGVFQARALAGAVFFAIPVFAVFAALFHEQVQSREQSAGNLAVWILAWALGTNALWLTSTPQAVASSSSQIAAPGCRLTDGIAILNRTPPGVVINSFDMGPWIAAYSEHGAVSGPYHRNESGISTAHRILTAEPEEARRLITSRGGRYLAWCRNAALLETNAKGLVAQIERGVTPSWIRPLTTHSGAELRLYEVKSQGSR